MAQKFNRNYKLLVDTQNNDIAFPEFGTPSEAVKIGPPFTISFNVHRDNLASTNRMEISIYNLGLATRTLLHKDVWQSQEYRAIELWAGYGDGNPTPIEQAANPNAPKKNSIVRQLFPRIFRGNVLRAYSYRQGTEFLTNIEAQDAGYAAVNSDFSRTYKKGTPYKQIMEDLINAMPTITVGAIGDFPGDLKKGNTYAGDPKQIMIDNFCKNFYIDNEKGYCLNDNEYLESAIPTIDDSSGILGIPIKETTLVKVDMLFEPGIIIGQSIQLDTRTVPYYNGLYKVTGLSHRGMISDSVCGALTTSLILTALDPDSLLVTQR